MDKDREEIAVSSNRFSSDFSAGPLAATRAPAAVNTNRSGAYAELRKRRRREPEPPNTMELEDSEQTEHQLDRLA